MPRSTFHDIIPPEKRSIRNIPIPSRGRKKKEEEMPEEEVYSEPTPVAEEYQHYKEEDPPEESLVAPKRHARKKEVPEDFEPTIKATSVKKGFGGRIGMWSIAILSIFALFFAFSLFLSKATVTVKAKTVSFETSKEITATKDGADGLSYSTITTEDTKEATVTGKGEKEVTEKAKGKLIIYNNFSKANQNLVANTRFETPEGLIFRLEKATVVPGQKADSAGKLIPGSVEVSVIADVAGPKYNIGPSDFTIPGFKNDPKFNTIYARSKVAFSGGMEGKVAVISDEERKIARESLETELTTSLKEKIKAEIPKEFFLPEGAFTVTVTFSEPIPGEANKATIKATGKIVGYIFNQNQLVNSLSEEQISPNAMVSISEGTVEKESIKESAGTLNAKMSGVFSYSFIIDEEKLKEDLKGKNKDDVSEFLKTFEGLADAKVVISPFWKSEIPEKVGKIRVIKE
ncbi:MAG: hypothetical protein QG585_81 [Patescibacteria group bacterium]|jgi:hypothetical protein|nr:hypothetical protein [Patescibacteria group bacterium]